MTSDVHSELRLCLLGADPVLADAVRAGVSVFDAVTLLALEGADVRHTDLKRLAQEVDALLVAWPVRAEAAPVFQALTRLSRPTRLSLVALCSSEAEQLTALQAGADEAVLLPLQVPLLRARLAVRRRLLEAHAGSGYLDAPPEEERGVRCGPLRANVNDRIFSVDGRMVDLTPKEFDLVVYLMQHAGACCTRDQILDHVWSIDFETGTNTVDVYMYFLRRKLKEHGYTKVIRTVRGIGYRLVVPEEEPAEMTG